MFITMEKCREGKGFSRFSAPTQRRLCEMEREIEIMGLKSKAMAKELRRNEKRIRRKTKVVANKAVRVAANRAVQVVTEVQVNEAQIQHTARTSAG